MSMTSAKSVKTVRPKKKSQPPLTEDEQQELLEHSNQIVERLAESQLDLAKLFLKSEKTDIALRRLHEIVVDYSGSAAATEARSLLKTL